MNYNQVSNFLEKYNKKISKKGKMLNVNEIILNLQSKEINQIKSYNSSCGICFLEQPICKKVTSCCHLYCYDCLLEWELFGGKLCPICKNSYK